jgi:hypothetical protein
MTDSKRVIKLKEKLKTRFGDRYIEFITDFNNINCALSMMTKKWNVSAKTLYRWAEILEYKDFGTKREMQRQYRLQKKMKDRQETVRQMLSVIARRKNIV